MFALILLGLSSPLHSSLATALLDTEELSFSSILSLTCTLSPLVTRSKRSIDLPDFSDTRQTFDYLYPHANKDPQNFSQGGGRSNSAPGLSWWLDDIVDLWSRECGRRKTRRKRHPNKANKKIRKRRANEERERNRMNPDSAITWAGYLGNISSAYNTYFPPPVEVGDEEYAEESKYETIEAANHEEEDNDSDKYEEDEEEEEEEEVETTTASTEKSKKEEETTIAPAAPTAPAPEPDPYFASYGGDVEYFFPLISFTIPFDGEITVLGFHGFKGMFPY